MERHNKFDSEEEVRPSLETARNLRSMFEAMKDQPTIPEKPKPKVNRFIVSVFGVFQTKVTKITAFGRNSYHLLFES